MAQFGRPDADISAGAWSAVTPAASLYQEIDESSASDTEYIYCPTANNACEVGLSNVTDPTSSTGHIVRVRARYTGGARNISVALKQGSTTIRSATVSVTGSFADYSFTLTGGEADSITDYTNLRLAFNTGATAMGFLEQVEVSWSELEVPDASSPTTVTPGTASLTLTTFAPVVTLGLNINQADLWTIQDPLSLTAVKNLSDAISWSDAAVVALAIHIADSIFSPSVVAVHPDYRINDGDYDGSDRGQNLKLQAFKNHSETWTLSEALVLATAKNLAEALFLADSKVLTAFKTLSETLTAGFVDSKVLGLSKLLSDAMGLADSKSMEIARAFTDAVSFADRVVKTTLKNTGDTLSLTDSKTHVLARALVETLSLLDAASKAVDKPLSDNWNVSDHSHNVFGKNLSDAMGLTDSKIALLIIGLAVSDSLSVSDAKSLGISIRRSDAMGLVDLLSKGLAKSLGDTLSLADSKTTLLNLVLALAETLAFTETLSKAASVLRTDAWAIADAKSLEALKNTAESLALSDSKHFGIAKTITDLLSLSDERRLAVAMVIGDALGFTDSQSNSVTPVVTAIIDIAEHGTPEEIAEAAGLLNEILESGDNQE